MNKYFDKAYILYGIKLDDDFSGLTIFILETLLKKLLFELQDTLDDNVFCYGSPIFNDDVTTIILFNKNGAVNKVRYIQANLETLGNQKTQSSLFFILTKAALK